MNELYTSLLQLQEIDQEISKAETRLKALTPRIAETRSPLDAIEHESQSIRTQLEKLRHQVRKLEHGADNKRQRLKAFEEKAQKARRRDEVGVKAEMDLIRGAVDAEVAELDETNMQVRRADMKLEDLHQKATKVQSEIDPRLQEIEAERQTIEAELGTLRQKRQNHTQQMDKNAVRLYDRVRTGKRAALAPLTPQGACGSCFNQVPMQEQTEIRGANGIRRCEACGVILYTTD
jgi:predicted  nucleic acid-binding Zn-ribbon protein